MDGATSARCQPAPTAPGYDPDARFDLVVAEVELRCNAAGRMLMARIYQPQGPGPFPTRLGVYGSSSGGHVAELLAMRPHDPRYTAVPLAGAPDADATVAWVAMRSPPSNTLARYENAVRRKNESMIASNKTFFSPWETI